MIRDLNRLAEKEYDILVVGGGVYGAATAREASLRGLSVAIIDKKDFCGATSANSLKIIHGGLRYLQKLDVSRTRESALERRRLMTIAPHLVHPLPCIMPTRGSLLKSKLALWTGMLANDIISYDRNSINDSEKTIPPGQIVSREKCVEILKGLDDSRITGGAIWHDAFAYNTERLVLEMIQSAMEAGATAVNYATLTGFKKSNNRITGALIKDTITGKEVEVSCKTVINNTGPWANTVLDLVENKTQKPVRGLSLGINFVLKRQLLPKFAAGLSYNDNSKERLVFFMPWRDQTIAGTYYRTHEGGPDEINITKDDISLLLDDLNKAYPVAGIEHDDIAMIHAGLLPTRDQKPEGRDPGLMDHFRLIDHLHTDGLEGLISVLGVKYTTACGVAEKTIDMAAGKLGKGRDKRPSCAKHLPGGDISDFNAFLKGIESEGLPVQLAYNYGTKYKQITDLCNTADDLKNTVCLNTHVLGAEILHAVRNEMALTLSDVVFRRTNLGSAGLPEDNVLKKCAEIISKELKWDNSRAKKEIAQVREDAFLPSLRNA